jgi:hypothetical protein
VNLAANSAYGSAANLAWLVKERQIEPHIPVFDKSNRTDGTFSRSDASCWCSSGGHSRRRARVSPRTGRGYAGQASLIAKPAPSRRSAVRTRRSAKCRVISTKMRGMSPEAWQTRRPTSVRVIAGRKSRCCSPISNASSDSVASDCAVRAAPETSSYSRPPLRTCGSSQSFERCQSLGPCRHDGSKGSGADRPESRDNTPINRPSP